MRKPLAIDLYAGLGGWTEGLLAEGWDVIGFDIERHDYGSGGYPAQLVLMDTRQIHGAMFAGADLIVASPPCQEFSYRAMPWKRAKALPPPVLGTNLFWQCWRIQNEACEAAGRYIPLVVENVKGAQPWVGRAKGRYGSFYLWGDVESVGGRLVRSGPVEFGMASVAALRSQKHNPDGTTHGQGSWFKVADSKQRGANGQKVEGFNFHQHENGGKGGSFQSAAVKNAELNGGSWFAIGSPGQTNVGKNPDGRKQPQGGGWFGDYQAQKANLLNGTKCGDDWFNASQPSLSRLYSSKSSARKAASAQIAKIPEPLSRHIARVFKPDL